MKTIYSVDTPAYSNRCMETATQQKPQLIDRAPNNRSRRRRRWLLDRVERATSVPQHTEPPHNAHARTQHRHLFAVRIACLAASRPTRRRSLSVCISPQSRCSCLPVSSMKW